jgi:hypothetical protein
VAVKGDLEDQGAMIDQGSSLSINLRQVYSGANLHYKVEVPQSRDFTASISQVQSYTLKASFPEPENAAVLAMADKQGEFYYIGINSIKENAIYVDTCALKGDQISCKAYWSGRVPVDLMKSPVGLLETHLRPNGDPIVFWTYQTSTMYSYLNLNTKTVMQEFKGTFSGLQVSSAKIGSDYVALVSKTSRYIEVYWEKDSPPFSTVLDQSSFSPQELEELEYFYPRDVVLDPTNPNFFFVKLPTRIARFAVLPNQQVKFVEIVRAFKNFVPDSEWTFIYTGNNILTVRDQEFR